MGHFLGQFVTRYFEELSRFSTLKSNTESICMKKNDDFPHAEKFQGPWALR